MYNIVIQLLYTLLTGHDNTYVNICHRTMLLQYYSL